MNTIASGFLSLQPVCVYDNIMVDLGLFVKYATYAQRPYIRETVHSALNL